MLFQTGKRIKVISCHDGFDFETKLNAHLQQLDKEGVHYEVQLDLSAGFIAYVLREEKSSIPETVAEEYQQAGESHTCIECPYFVRPTDGRRKYTRCERCNKLRTANTPCCEDFYILLDKGEINLV